MKSNTKQIFIHKHVHLAEHKESIFMVWIFTVFLSLESAFYNKFALFSIFTSVHLSFIFVVFGYQILLNQLFKFDNLQSFFTKYKSYQLLQIAEMCRNVSLLFTLSVIFAYIFQIGHYPTAPIVGWLLLFILSVCLAIFSAVVVYVLNS